jgi:hypothetical protein
MSIDDLVTYLSVTAERCKADFLLVEAHERIIAILRAGEALAFEAEVAERAFCRLHNDAHGTEAVPVEFSGVSKARRVWDAAALEEK